MVFSSGNLHGDLVFGHGLGVVVHHLNLFEGPCLGLVDDIKIRSV
jgi:hypothetical protein